MPDLDSATPSPAGTGEGLAPVSAEQAPGSGSTPSISADQPGRAADPSDQPKTAWDSELGWKSPEDAKRDYKNLQAAFTKATQVLKDMGNPDQVRSQMAMLRQLREDPEFITWAKQRLAQAQTGSADADTMRALEIVDARAEAKARELLEQVVGPLQLAHLEQKTRTVFSAMDQAHGPDWQEKKAAMGELHLRDMQRGLVSPGAEYNFDYDYVNGLYARVIAADPNYAAKQYEKRLAAKRAVATESQPGTAPAAVGGGKITSLLDAFNAAKRQHGMA